MTILDPNTEHGERAEVDADVAKAILDARWGELLAWLGWSDALGAPAVPEVGPLVRHWLDYDKRWRAGGWGLPRWDAPGLYHPRDREKDEIAGQRQNLAVAESNAASHGYAVSRWTIGGDGKVSRVDPAAPTGPKSPGPTLPHDAARRDAARGPTVVLPPPGPSQETLHPVAAAVERALPPPPEKPTPPDPYMAAKVAAVSVAGLATVAGTIAAKGDAARIGVAALGAVATGGLAALLFLPSTPSQKKDTPK